MAELPISEVAAVGVAASKEAVAAAASASMRDCGGYGIGCAFVCCFGGRNGGGAGCVAGLCVGGDGGCQGGGGGISCGGVNGGGDFAEALAAAADMDMLCWLIAC